MLRKAAAALTQRVFGGTCMLCRGEAGQGLLCAACDADLPRLGGALCPRCAVPSTAGAICGRCLSHPPRFDATVAALEYRFPADVLVQALKFRGELALAALLARLLEEGIDRGPPVHFIVPVPLAAQRLRERGYNQALEIARHLARATGAQLALDACERTRDTPAQMGLPWAERAANLRGAFRAQRSLDGATIAVLDDVMTTGATLNEIAGALKRSGAAYVVNWVVARTFPPD
jgi:ComF family protein